MAGLALLALLSGTVAAAAASETIRDEFDAPSVTKYWFACKRQENSFFFGKVAGETRTAATAIVNSLPSSNALALMWSHKGCANGSGHYEPDKYERAELWEADGVWAPIGTDIWHRFDMFVDDSITPSTGRFVIGQWKQSNSPKDAPLLAQRFNGRAFTITMEQDNADPARSPEDVLCRVYIASQATAPVQPGEGMPHELAAPVLFSTMAKQTLSVGHDLEDVSHDDASETGLSGCATGLRVTRFNPLPDPFGKWTTMVYHLRLKPDDTGLVEIWANGKKISKTEGVIGFKPFRADSRQYFKFGPYRNSAAFSTTTRLDHYVRSEVRTDVDPDGTLAP
ncbi:heparin lyase I family protein [Bradyrhizobium sp. BRP14]|nr:heparin lyase I family protein [Bradyrhizobium sp. BRP14]